MYFLGHPLSPPHSLAKYIIFISPPRYPDLGTSSLRNLDINETLTNKYRGIYVNKDWTVIHDSKTKLHKNAVVHTNDF